MFIQSMYEHYYVVMIKCYTPPNKVFKGILESPCLLMVGWLCGLSQMEYDYCPVSSDKSAAMKETFGNIKLIMIDEISMVSAGMLLTIHRHLCDIKGTYTYKTP
ncbi:hypothetical protein ACF0H5_010122 [Mactra antiquata]